MTDKPKTSDETRIIVPTIGPYARRRMTVSAAEADQAISEGWARDPFAPVEEPKAGEEPKQLTDQEREELSNKARAAAERWRGEDKNESKAGKTETRDMAPAKDERSDYQTKTAAGPPKRR